MANTLANRCGVCNSTRWCGRPCANDPSGTRVLDVAPAAVLDARPPVSLTAGGVNYLPAYREPVVLLPASVYEAAEAEGIPLDGFAEQKPIPVEKPPPSYRHRDPEKRRAYQRDLMRKRRAASG
jgi:hypothetical protein